MSKPIQPTTATGFVVLAVLALLLGCTLEQVEIGRWYTLYTPRTGACPVLEWQFLVNAQRQISGYLSPAYGARTANISGTLNPDDSFQMMAREVQGNRTSSITGRFNQQLTIFTIHGDIAGDDCDGQALELRFVYYFGPYVSGG
jgi:hypothetical protein